MHAFAAGWRKSATARLLLRGALNAMGLLIIFFGLGLLMFCVVVLGHDVLPLIAAPDTAAFQLYRFLLVTVSFNIIFHYVCATTFSARLGRGAGAVAESDEVATHAAEPACSSPPHARDAEGDDEGKEGQGHVMQVAHAEGMTRRQDNSDSGAATCVQRGHERTCCRCCPASAGRRPLCHNTTCAQSAHDWLGRACRTVVRVCVTGQLRPQRLTSPAVLRELERVAGGLEALPPSLRRYRLLDEARRYCRHCARLKAPREHHCSICNACVPKMDHHCPWLNNCVDETNERNFYLFIVWLWVGALTASVVLLGTTYIVPQPLFVARGYGLDALPVCFTLALVLAMFACMCFFLVNCTAHILTNTTPIEHALVQERQERVFGSTGFVYRNPYDLGPWRNALAFFATAHDPLLRDARRRHRGSGWRPQYIRTLRATAEEHDGLVAHNSSNHHFYYDREGQKGAGRGARLWHTVVDYGADVLLLLWLVVPPSMRDNGADGLHYITLEEVISRGEQVVTMPAAGPCEADAKSVADTASLSM